LFLPRVCIRSIDDEIQFRALVRIKQVSMWDVCPSMLYLDALTTISTFFRPHSRPATMYHTLHWTLKERVDEQRCAVHPDRARFVAVGTGPEMQGSTTSKRPPRTVR